MKTSTAVLLAVLGTVAVVGVGFVAVQALKPPPPPPPPSCKGLGCIGEVAGGVLGIIL